MILLAHLPLSLRVGVSEQRYFQQALRMALTSHDPQTVRDTAAELRWVSANALLAVESARLRSDAQTDWIDCARVAALQSLAAVTGADLLDQAAAALAVGGAVHHEFRDGLRALVGLSLPDASPVPAATS